jgi:hypothetical protein
MNGPKKHILFYSRISQYSHVLEHHITKKNVMKCFMFIEVEKFIKRIPKNVTKVPAIRTGQGKVIYDNGIIEFINELSKEVNQETGDPIGCDLGTLGGDGIAGDSFQLLSEDLKRTTNFKDDNLQECKGGNGVFAGVGQEQFSITGKPVRVDPNTNSIVSFEDESAPANTSQMFDQAQTMRSRDDTNMDSRNQGKTAQFQQGNGPTMIPQQLQASDPRENVRGGGGDTMSAYERAQAARTQDDTQFGDTLRPGGTVKTMKDTINVNSRGDGQRTATLNQYEQMQQNRNSDLSSTWNNQKMNIDYR